MSNLSDTRTNDYFSYINWAVGQCEDIHAKLADEERMAKALYDVNHTGPVSHPPWETRSDDCKLVYRQRAKKMIKWLMEGEE